MLAPVSYGAITTLSGTLNGANESPSNASPGIGFTTVIYDSTAHTLSVNVTFSGLTGPTTASHIHCCTATAGTGTAGVATTTPTFAGFPTSYNPAFITANGGTTASAEAALAGGFANGTSYLNIHTTPFPGGEIRAFLTLGSVPALSGTAIALLAGLLAITGAAILRRS